MITRNEKFEANRVECPYCKASVGFSCTVVHGVTKGWLTKSGPHKDRLIAAELCDAKPSADTFDTFSVEVTVLRPTTVTMTHPLPAGYTLKAKGRYPEAGEVYLRLDDNGGVVMERLALGHTVPLLTHARSDEAEHLNMSGYLPSHIIILSRKLVAVYSFVETGETRVPRTGEWYAAFDEIRYCTEFDHVDPHPILRQLPVVHQEADHDVV